MRVWRVVAAVSLINTGTLDLSPGELLIWSRRADLYGIGRSASAEKPGVKSKNVIQKLLAFASERSGTGTASRVTRLARDPRPASLSAEVGPRWCSALAPLINGGSRG